MGAIILRIAAVFLLYIFGSMTYHGFQDYTAAGEPLPAIAKTEPTNWKLIESREGTDYKHYSLFDGKHTFKICEDTRGYIECSRFISKRVQGYCPASASGSSEDKVTCDQFLGRRLESEPLVVAYNNNDLVSVSRANGDPVLQPSEWANARKDSLQRKALWKMGMGAIWVLIALCSL